MGWTKESTFLRRKILGIVLERDLEEVKKTCDPTREPQNLSDSGMTAPYSGAPSSSSGIPSGATQSLEGQDPIAESSHPSSVEDSTHTGSGMSIEVETAASSSRLPSSELSSAPTTMSKGKERVEGSRAALQFDVRLLPEEQQAALREITERRKSTVRSLVPPVRPHCESPMHEPRRGLRAQPVIPPPRGPRRTPIRFLPTPDPGPIDLPAYSLRDWLRRNWDSLAEACGLERVARGGAWVERSQTLCAELDRNETTILDLLPPPMRMPRPEPQDDAVYRNLRVGSRIARNVAKMAYDALRPCGFIPSTLKIYDLSDRDAEGREVRRRATWAIPPSLCEAMLDILRITGGSSRAITLAGILNTILDAHKVVYGSIDWRWGYNRNTMGDGAKTHVSQQAMIGQIRQMAPRLPQAHTRVSISDSLIPPSVTSTLLFEGIIRAFAPDEEVSNVIVAWRKYGARPEHADLFLKDSNDINPYEGPYSHYIASDDPSKPQEAHPAITTCNQELDVTPPSQTQRYTKTWALVQRYLEGEDWSANQKEQEHIKRLAEDFLVRDGSLYRKPSKRWPVPRLLVEDRDEQLAILHAAHEGPIGGHRSEEGTTDKICMVFYWPEMRKDIRHHVSSCEECQRQQRRRPKIPYRASLVQHLHARVYVDLMDLPKGVRRMRHVLDIREDLSSWVWAKPLRGKSAKEIAKGLLEYMHLFGFVLEIVADNGAVNSAEVRDLLEGSGVEIKFSYPYHPEGNAVVERGHQSLTKALEIYAAKDPKKWPDYVSLAALADNSTVRRTTGYSPFELFMGRRNPFPFEANLNTWPHSSTSYTRAELLAERMKQLSALQEARDEAQNKGQLAREKAVFYANRTRRTPDPIKEGDLVLLIEGEQLMGRYQKFRPRWLGPYRVHEVSGSGFLLEELDGSRLANPVHRNRLKRFRKREEPPQTMRQVPDSE